MHRYFQRAHARESRLNSFQATGGDDGARSIQDQVLHCGPGKEEYRLTASADLTLALNCLRTNRSDWKARTTRLWSFVGFL